MGRVTHVVVQASHRAEFRVNAFLILSRAFAADKDRHAVAANARDDDHSPSVPTGLMTPLRSDEDVACARDADISASSASGTPTSKCFVHAPADSPNGTPQENREACWRAWSSSSAGPREWSCPRRNKTVQKCFRARTRTKTMDSCLPSDEMKRRRCVARCKRRNR